MVGSPVVKSKIALPAFDRLAMTEQLHPHLTPLPSMERKYGQREAKASPTQREKMIVKPGIASPELARTIIWQV